MDFTLSYRGPLKANAGPKEKQLIRRYFHKQFAILWQQFPLSSVGTTYLKPAPDPRNAHLSILRDCPPFTFAPLVCARQRWTASLDITFLRPEAPGSLITQGGDIDNRIKTLLDALRMPHNLNELPKDDQPATDERPFFCLLEDDNLVTGLRVTTDRLLEGDQRSSDVLLIIKVNTVAHQTVFATLRL